MTALAPKTPTAPVASRPGLRPEAELLLCCARTQVDAPTAERIRALVEGGLDWFYVIRTVLTKGTLPLLYRNLSAVCPDAVPAATLEQLRRQFEANAARNARLADELLRLVDLFAARGIRALPFKGPALAVAAYGDLALRQFCDLDVLVPERDAARAVDLLLAEGYTSSVRVEDPVELARCFGREKDVGFTSPDGAVLLELHWRFTQRHSRFVDVESLWGRLETTALGGRSVPGLRAEDLFLVLCAHGSKHYWERLDWVCDVAELVRARPGVDWRDVFARARATGVRRMLLLGLALAEDLLGCRLPDDVGAEARADAVVRWIVPQLRARLFDDGGGAGALTISHVTAEGVPLSMVPVHLRMRERPLDAAREALYLLRGALTPTARDRAVVRLPAPLSVGYYLLRPVRLVADYGMRPVRYLFQVAGYIGPLGRPRK
jgi:hypothetical protein